MGATPDTDHFLEKVAHAFCQSRAELWGRGPRWLTSVWGVRLARWLAIQGKFPEGGNSLLVSEDGCAA